MGPGDSGHINILLNYFEEDSLQLANVFAFLHLLLLVQDALLGLLNNLFGTSTSLATSLRLFSDTFATRIDGLAHSTPTIGAILEDLGDWKPAGV